LEWIKLLWFKIKKVEFFSFSSSVLYKTSLSLNLGLVNRIALPFSKNKIIFNWKKMGITLLLVILAIIIKSICQYFLGAQETSLEKILSGLDYPFYQGCFLGGIIMVFIQDNWNNMWDYLYNSFTMKFDSGDENSGDEAIKKSLKGKDKITDSNINNKAIDKNLEEEVTKKEDKNLEEVTKKEELSSGSSSNIKLPSKPKLTLDEIVQSTIIAGETAADTKDSADRIREVAKAISKYTILDLNKIDINNKKDVDTFFIDLLKQHGILYSHYTVYRDTWIKCRLANLTFENTSKVKEGINKYVQAREKYLSAIGTLDNHESVITQAKVYYSILNEQRNVVNKELNEVEEIILKDLRQSPFCTTHHEDCKKLVRSLLDYNNAKKEFNTQDSLLKKKIGEAINKKP
jgi:hypothetical protein